MIMYELAKYLLMNVLKPNQSSFKLKFFSHSHQIKYLTFTYNIHNSQLKKRKDT